MREGKGEFWVKYFEKTFEVKWFEETGGQVMERMAEQVKTWLAGLKIGLTVAEEKRKDGSGGYINVFYTYPGVKHLIRVSFYNTGSMVYYGIKKSGNTDDVTGNGYGHGISKSRISRYSVYVLAGEKGLILSFSIPKIYDTYYCFSVLNVVDEAGGEVGVIGGNESSNILDKMVYSDENLEMEETVGYLIYYGENFGLLKWDGYCFLLPLFLSESGINNSYHSSMDDKKFLMFKEMKLALGKKFTVGKMYAIGGQKYYCVFNSGYYVNYMIPIDN